MKPHFLQSETWTKFQIELGRHLIKGSGDGWSYTGLVEHDRFGKYVYVPYGPFAINKKALEDAVDDLKRKAAEIGAYVVNVEPTPPITTDIARRVFRYEGYHRQAHRTIHIDLERTEDEILADMNKTRRKQHRNYSKKGLTIEKSNTRETLDIFYNLLTISSSEKGFYVRNKHFFEMIFEKMIPLGYANMFIAKRDEKVEVAALVYEDEDTRYYAHVGRDLSDNSLQASAPLISYMIIDAKRSGKKNFDLYGISRSDDAVDEKSGFTVFKKTFGGRVVEFAGAWEIPIKPAVYNLKKLFQKAKKIVRKSR